MRKEIANINPGPGPELLERWTGTFRYNNIPRTMNLDTFSITRSPNGPISGSGSDFIGSFQITGNVGSDGVLVSFRKTYSSGQLVGTIVTYNGRLVSRTFI